MVALPIDRMVAMEITFRGSIGMPRAEYPLFLSHIADNKNIDPKKLITRRVPIEEAQGVLSDMTDFGTLGMVVIDRW